MLDCNRIQILAGATMVCGLAFLGTIDDASAQSQALFVHDAELGGTPQPDGQNTLVDQSYLSDPAHLATAWVQAGVTGTSVAGVALSASPDLAVQVRLIDDSGAVLGQVEQQLGASQQLVAFAAPVPLAPKQRATILIGKSAESSVGDQLHTFSASAVQLADGTQIPLGLTSSLSYRNAPVRIQSIASPLLGAHQTTCAVGMFAIHAYTPGDGVAIDEVVVESSFDAVAVDMQLYLSRFDPVSGAVTSLVIPRSASADPHVSSFDVHSAVQSAPETAQLDGLNDGLMYMCVQINSLAAGAGPHEVVIPDIFAHRVGTVTRWKLPSPEDLFGQPRVFAFQVLTLP